MNVQTIYKVFEDAFTGYFVSFEKKPEVHVQRWLSAGVDFSLSYGVKIDGNLVAFILHAPKGDLVHNLATGVRRDFQGQGLTGLMYEKIFQELPGKGFKKARLEVITENLKAIRAYEKAGFQKKRKLLCWKGVASHLPQIDGDYSISPVQYKEELSSLSSFANAFEQDWPVVQRRSELLEQHELKQNGKTVAYAIWNPWQMNLVQLAGVDSEKIGGLLQRMKLNGENFGMVNVDEKNASVNDLFRNQGLENYISQYEMEMPL